MPDRNNPLNSVQELARMAEVLARFGIIDTARTLDEEFVRPSTCMRDATTSLHFMGYGGRKWRDEPWFAVELARLHRRDGEVRFLISDQIDVSELGGLAELMREYPRTLQTRIMNDRPLFRLVCIDRRKMLIGHYGHEVIFEDGTNAQGWQSPHLIVEHGSEWSLIIPFMVYYNEVWERSKMLEEVPLPHRQRRTFS